MGVLAERAAAIVAELTEAGVRATDDPRSLLAPGVLVGPPSLEPSNLGGCAYDATWRLELVGIGAGGHDAFVSVDTLLSAVLPLLPGYQSAVPGTFTLTPGSDPLPSYTVTWMEAVPWP